MKQLIFLIIICFFSSPIILFGQLLTFQKVYAGGHNDLGINLTETADGYLLSGVGRNKLVTFNTDGILICTDKVGNICWQKNYGGADAESFNSAIKMKDGSIFACGKTEKKDTDIFLVKTDSLGNTIWQKKLGRTLISERSNAPIISTANEDLLVSGEVVQLVGSNVLRYGSIIAKIDQKGTTLWSRKLSLGASPDSMVTQDYRVYHASDSIIYGCGTHADNTVFMSIGSNTGEITRLLEYKHSNYTLKPSGLRPTLDGNLVILGYAEPIVGGNTPGNPQLLFLLKIRPNGEVMWCKAYEPNHLWRKNFSSFDATSDGGFVLNTAEQQPNQSSSVQTDVIMLMKLNSEGDVVLKKFYPIDSTINNATRTINYCRESKDSGFVMVGQTSASTSFSEVFFIKTDASGETAGCCSITRPNKGAINFPIQSDTVGYVLEDYEPFADTMLTPQFAIDFIAEDICQIPQPTRLDTVRICPGESATIGDSVYSQPTVIYRTLPSTSDDCDTLATIHVVHLPAPALTQEIAFCPGDTVWVNGQAYTQADTLYSLLPATAGCDTAVTLILRDVSDPVPGGLSLTCPANLVVTMPAGVDSIVVDYDLPVAFSDCACPGIALSRTSGNESGAYFTAGNHLMCFQAEDACEQFQSCCFNIRVEKEASAAPCDVKTSGCMRFEVLQVSRDADQHWVYDIRVTNNCSDAVKYLYLQVPKGLYADEPVNQTGYTSPDGLAYAVRNPNFSPFYSIRFQPQGSGLANGESDVFQYALPAQASVRYIHAAVRLSSGAYVETHLNTFSCPVGVANGSQSRATDVTRLLQAAPEGVLVYPNPLSTERALTVLGVDTEGCALVLTDVTGQMVLETPIVEGQVYLEGTVLPNGLYFFRVQRATGEVTGSGRLVVVR
jgi:hypothetical protein